MNISPVPFRYASICSGIEAVSVAWEPLGFEPAWFAEIDRFACALLTHHYPHVPNHGDLTLLPARMLAGELEAPDILVGGTPCQAFSFAGLRQGLADPRGALTLSYVELANAIDHIRLQQQRDPAVLVWENVPGVLSDKGNAFGCFLGALAGECCELQPPGGKWKDAGAVYSHQRAIAWRILDAQYFGLAQRRRRVFVVASARAGFDPAQVLFEREGVRRDIAPSRAPWPLAATAVVRGTAIDRHSRNEPELANPPYKQVYCMAQGQGGAENAMEQSPTLTCNHETGIVVHLRTATNVVSGEASLAFSCKDHGADVDVISPTLRAMNHLGSHANSGGQVAIAYPLQNATRGQSQHGVGVGNQADPMYTLDTASQHAVCITGEITHPLKAEGFDASEDGTGRGHPIVPVNSTKLHHTAACRAGKLYEHYTTSLDASNSPPALLMPWQVRRLTPRECERLQGMPDDYTQIPWRGKRAEQCPDGPRYRAIGNSMAVPCMAWIGRRLLHVLGNRVEPLPPLIAD